MLQESVAIACVLAVLSALNAHRSRVRAVRDKTYVKDGSTAQSPKKARKEWFWDVAKSYPEVLNFSDYLLSLKFTKPLTLRGLLVGFALSKFRRNLLLQFICMVVLGGIPFIGYIKIADEPIDLLKLLENGCSIHSIGTWSSLADIFHHLKPASKAKANGDAVLKFKKSVRCEPSLPHYDALEAFPKVLTEYPDEMKMATPSPLVDEVLPDLCLGWGGLRPLQTERTAQRNGLVAEMLNRLSANLLVYADVLDPSDLFLVKWGEDSIRTVEDFVEKVPGIKMFFSRNSSSFGFMVCVKEDDQKYRQLPLVWTGRTAIRDPDTGNQFSTLSYHSSLVIIGTPDCPLGEFRAQFFLGPEGVTGWKPGNEYIKPWAPILSDPPLNESQTIEACRASTCVAAAINLASRMQDLSVGGYALHGSCVDTTAIIKQIVFGEMQEFPLVASGDARAGAIAACTYLEKALKREELLPWAKEFLKRLGETVARLPDDTSIPPPQLLSAIDRFQASLIGEFSCVPRLKDELTAVRVKWKNIFSSSN